MKTEHYHLAFKMAEGTIFFGRGSFLLMELLDVSPMAVSESLDSEDGHFIENLCGFPFQCIFIYAGQIYTCRHAAAVPAKTRQPAS